MIKDKHDWRAVEQALYDLMAHTEENEPQAVNFLAAIQETIDGLPHND